jgi:hypothetical protein
VSLPYFHPLLLTSSSRPSAFRALFTLFFETLRQNDIDKNNNISPKNDPMDNTLVTTTATASDKNTVAVAVAKPLKHT